jgi:hypothetical protein
MKFTCGHRQCLLSVDALRLTDRPPPSPAKGSYRAVCTPYDERLTTSTGRAVPQLRSLLAGG